MGVALNLINVRSSTPAPHRGPVIVVHGAGVRANIFRAPGQATIVDALAAAGYDVWLENWRASIDFPPEWTLDQAALYDHPQAVRKIVAETGYDKIKAIIHCQGSTSFSMSALAGLVPEVTTIVSNAVSLHPVVSGWARIKLDYAVPVVNALTPYLNPHWGVEAPTLVAKGITALVKLFHHECRNTVCKMVSFTYGSGFPALWRHENLTNPPTNGSRRNSATYPCGSSSRSARCVRARSFGRGGGFAGAPRGFHRRAPDRARFAFFAGAKNRCFLPESQQRS